MGFILGAAIVWFICGLVASQIAQNKGNDSCGGFLLGVLFGPLGILIVAVMSTNPKFAQDEALRLNYEKAGRGELRRCPYCAEFVQAAAAVCRYCGRDLPKSIEMESSDLRRNDSAKLYKKAFTAQFEEKDTVKAISYYEKLLDMFPNSYEAPMAKQQITVLRGRAVVTNPEVQPKATSSGKELITTCVKCGSPNPISNKFCSSCGQPI